MKLKQARYENGKSKWVVVNDDYTLHPEALYFSNQLYAGGYSVNTIEGYLRNVKVFLEYLCIKDILLIEVKPIHVAQFIEYLKGYEQEGIINIDNDSRIKNATINRILAALATFYRVLERGEKALKSPFAYSYGMSFGVLYKSFLSYTQAGNKVKKRDLRVHTRKETQNIARIQKYENESVKRLFPHEIKRFLSGLTGYRDRLMFEILYETGMRIGELLGLKLNDYSEPGPDDVFGYIYIIPTDGNDDGDRQQKSGYRQIVVTANLLSMINTYVTEHRPYIEEEQYIFVTDSRNHKGVAVSRRSIEKIFSECSDKTNIKCTPHLLRHTHLTELAEAGFDQLFIKERAGHKSIYSTERYTHLSIKAQTDAYQRYLKNRGII